MLIMQGIFTKYYGWLYVTFSKCFIIQECICHVRLCLLQCHNISGAILTNIYQFLRYVFTFHAYNDMAPAYLCDLVKHYVPGRSGLRSETQRQLERTVTRLKTYGDRSFQYAAINEWHRLPLSIRECSSIDLFKSELKTHFFKLYYD